MIFALCVTFMVGVWLGLYVADVLGPSKKAKKKVLEGLEFSITWGKPNLEIIQVKSEKHITDAIEFIEKHT